MKQRPGRSFLWFLTAAFPAGSLLAAPSVPAVPLPDQSATVVRMFGALVFVLALFLLGVWLWRNWQRLLAQNGRAPKLRVVEARSLGGRHTLYVVGYEADRWMLAVSPAGISVLAQLPPAETAGEAAPPAPQARGFAEKLNQLLTRS